MKREYF